MRTVRLLLLFTLAVPCHILRAQGVRGRLVEGESALPIAGALVTLEDSGGGRLAQSVSGGGGRFTLLAPRAGTYRMRVLRIGYHPRELAVQLIAGEMIEKTIELTDMPVALPEITVAGVSVCGNRARGDTLSSALWTEAGTALAITAQTVRTRAFRFETVHDDQQIDRVGVSTVPSTTKELSINAWPVRSPDADSLLVNGFIENIDDLQVGPTWYGPDAEFLLSDAFFSGHCFRTVPAGVKESPAWVGLAFEPAATDRRADIRGTLWLDRASAELRRLDFEYTRLPKWARGTEAGGELRFAPLPDGGWIVQRWMLHVPVPEVDVGSGRARVRGFRESGGHVVAVLDATGAVLQRYPE